MKPWKGSPSRNEHKLISSLILKFFAMHAIRWDSCAFPFYLKTQKLPSPSVFGLQRKPSKLKYICAPLQGFGELSSCVFLLCKLSTVRHLFQKQNLSSVSVFGLQQKLSKPKYMSLENIWKRVKSDETMDGRTVHDPWSQLVFFRGIQRRMLCC